MKAALKRTLFVASISYVLIFASVAAILFTIKIATGYYPSLLYFTLSFVTLGLFVIHPLFLLAPLAAAIVAMIILSKTKANKSITEGLAVASYYVLAILLYLIKGAGDVEWKIFLIWTAWVFVIGFASSKIADKAIANRH